MFVSPQDKSVFTGLQIEHLNFLIPESLRDEFWHQYIFNYAECRTSFESQIVKLAKDKPANEYCRGIAWLCFRFTGLISTNVLAELKLIPLFKKHSIEFDTGLTFEDASLVAYRYFPTDQFEMIGRQY